MVELTSIFNGRNNGNVFLSFRDAADRLGMSDHKAIAAAFEELEVTGLLTLTIHGHFAVKAGNCRANAYRLNWVDGEGQPCGPDALPTLDDTPLTPKMRKRMAKRSRALSTYIKDLQQGKFSVEENTTLTPRIASERHFSGGISVEENTTAHARNGRNASLGVLEDSSTHILYQRGAGIRCPGCSTPFILTRANQRFCSPKCRTTEEKRRAYSRRRAANDEPRSGWWQSINPIIEKIGAEIRAAA